MFFIARFQPRRGSCLGRARVSDSEKLQHYQRLRTKLEEELDENELVRQSQIVQSVMQDYQYDLSHLLPVCNLLVQGPKITYNYR